MVIVREGRDKMYNDLISRKAVLSLPRKTTRNFFGEIVEESIDVADIEALPFAQPERMTNRQWVDFLSAQFDISRTSAKEMLHGMMRWKKEDNFKKMFNGGKT